MPVSLRIQEFLLKKVRDASGLNRILSATDVMASTGARGLGVRDGEGGPHRGRHIIIIPRQNKTSFITTCLFSKTKILHHFVCTFYNYVISNLESFFSFTSNSSSGCAIHVLWAWADSSGGLITEHSSLCLSFSDSYCLIYHVANEREQEENDV